MKTLTKNKGILVVVAIFIVAMFLYNTFFSTETVLVQDGLSSSGVGINLLEISEKLQRVTLDQSIFSSNGYLLLNDFSTSITPQVIGRPNPFGIIGRD